MPSKKSPVPPSQSKTRRKDSASTVARTVEKPQRRARRSTETVRRLILEAARELFAERGYAGATTREIAQRADINEVLLFRHFTSKAQLFEQAVFEPCQGFIEEFSRKHPPTPMHASAETAREFVTGLYQVFHENRRLMMALIAASFYEPEITRSLAHIDAIQDYYKGAEDYVRLEGANTRLGIGTGVRLSFGLVAATVLFEDWMFAGVRKPSARRLIDDLSAFMEHGFVGAPTAGIDKPAVGINKPQAASRARPRSKKGAKTAR
jgi:AcrR family transcriptional regulator